MPKISVILPIYNGEQTLKQTLKSLICQRFDDFDIVAVNDGSMDKTADILDEGAAKHTQIQIVHKPHTGLIDTLNVGLSASNSPYIARCDADDVMHPDRLRLQAAYLDSHPDIAVVSSRIQCYPRPHIATGFRIYEHWLNSLTTPDTIARDMFVESPIVHPSILARKSAIDAVGQYCEFDWAEDYDLWLRLHLSGFQFAKLPQTLHYWRETNNRLTRQDGRYSTANFLKAKTHYLIQGPLASHSDIIIWGSGQIGRRLCRNLTQSHKNVVAFVEIAPQKIGKTHQNVPIIAPTDLLSCWQNHNHPFILSAVPARGARQHIRQYLRTLKMTELQHFICVA